jgi:hypothetical protein
MDQTSQPVDKASTVGAHVQLSLLGFDANNALVQQLQDVLCDLVLDCGTQMNLHLLDGITVGADYKTALDSVDLGYVSSVAKGYTNEDGMIGAAKTLRVKRDGQVRAHIVFADMLGPLLDVDHERFGATVNLVVHELSHVAVMGWLEANAPNTYLEPVAGDWATNYMRENALVLWEEYAVCRLSAGWGTDTIQADLAENVELSVAQAWQRAQQARYAFGEHHDVSKVFVEVAVPLAKPLKTLAYLLGHLDGAERDINLGQLCPTFAASDFAEFAMPLCHTLRQVWEIRHAWSSLTDLDDIVALLVAVMGAAGVSVDLLDEAPGTWVQVLGAE